MRERLKKTMPSKAHHEILTAVGSICTQNLLLPIALVITVVGTCAAADSGKHRGRADCGKPDADCTGIFLFRRDSTGGIAGIYAGKPFDRIRTEADPRSAQSDVRKAVAAVRRYVE